MTESIPVSLLEGWISEMRRIRKGASARTRTDLLINQGMQFGLDQIRHRIKTWSRHQKYVQTLRRSGRKFLVVRRVNLSQGHLRKLEWYEGDLFLTLAWRHGQNEETGELVMEIQRVQDLSKTFLVYQGGSSFDDLAALAREGGLDSVRNEENRGEWVEETLP